MGLFDFFSKSEHHISQKELREMFLKAAKEGDVEKLQIALDKGININEHDIYGNTALFKATMYNHVEAVRLLIARGADIYAADSEGTTPFNLSIHWQQKREIKKLFEDAVAKNKP